MIAALVLAWVGAVLRDRWVWSQVVWFVPIAPIAAAILVIDLLRRGRSVRPRFAVSALSLLTIVMGMTRMIGGSSPEPIAPGKPSVRVLHWNVLWGVLPKVWPTIADDIRAQSPDIVVLSEAANRWQIAEELAALGYQHFVLRENPPRKPYTWRLAVASRWPVEFEALTDIPTGKAMRVRVETPDGPFRILLVDGGSAPWEARRPRIEAVARLVEQSTKSGAPIDLVAGDFNTPGTSVGFDPLRAAGWRFASDYSGTWRGTFRWPWAPLWDIDHVIASPGWSVQTSVFTTHEWLDHRGQVVEMVGK
jgi:endonuclease/exonuclease/phosphatase (EEP) superfamily protein YafD